MSSEAVITSIYSEPEKWKQTEYTFKHESGVEIWTANGFFFYDIYRGSNASLVWKFRFSAARKWWFKNAPLEHIARH